MADYQAPLRDMRFVLEELLDVPAQWAALPRLAGSLDADTARAVLEEAARLCAQRLAPLNRSGDEEGCQWRAEGVATPAGFAAAWRAWAEGGWVGLSGEAEHGGLGMPKALAAQVEELLNAANLSFALYPMLSAGAALTLAAHADATLRALYLPRLYRGEWAGAMCLTEPQAGTDLGLIRTRAEPDGDGSYRIFGGKIFITGGEHDLTPNIVHLLLARLPDAPPGSKGISLFLVPKFLVEADGSLGARNAMSCGALEHKMGIKASSTCVMHYDGARGWLVGAPHQGLAAMFTMMNYERLGVGIQGLAAGERSWQNARAYARERLQGRAPGGAVAPGLSADPIVAQPDVRRMLLTMRALTEGGRAFSSYVASQLDLARDAPQPDLRAAAEARVALLTPVAKAFLTDLGLEVCVLGQQVFGGHGYIREWGQEQLVRDVRITQIYEGTNGIQALDLAGRKLVADGGALYRAFAAEMRADLDTAGEFAAPLAAALDNLDALSDWLIERGRRDPREIGAASVEYLQVFGYTVYAWLWARMARLALAREAQEVFYAEKLATARFYFARLLPRIHALSAALRSGSAVLYDVPESLL